METKSPTSIEQHTFDWAAEMALSSPVDTISTSTWYADTGLIIDSSSKTSTTTTCVRSGGRAYTYATLRNHIVCASGREYDRTMIVEVKPILI